MSNLIKKSWTDSTRPELGGFLAIIFGPWSVKVKEGPRLRPALLGLTSVDLLGVSHACVDFDSPNSISLFFMDKTRKNM